MIEVLLITILGFWNIHLGTELMDQQHQIEALQYSDIYEQFARETDVCELKYRKDQRNREACWALAYAKFCNLSGECDNPRRETQ